jgi:hypothetical protein
MRHAPGRRQGRSRGFHTFLPPTSLTAGRGPSLPCRHLDGDEATVLGAGLFAANLSTTFRLRKFGMTDKVPYTITLRMDGGEEGAQHSGGSAWAQHGACLA